MKFMLVWGMVIAITTLCAETGTETLGCWRTRFGNMKISRDIIEDATRIDTTFESTGKKEAYPEFTPSKTIKAKFLIFEAKAVQETPELGYSSAEVRLLRHGKRVNFDTWSPAPYWQQFVINLKELNATEVDGLQIGAAPKSLSMALWIRNLHFSESLPTERVPAAAALVTAKSPSMVFIDGEAPEFKVNSPVPNLKCTVFNYLDQKVAECKATEKLVLPLLPRGFYRIMFEAPGRRYYGCRSFCIVPDPDRRPNNPNSSFCLDAALGPLSMTSVRRFAPNDWDKTTNYYAYLIKLAGVNLVRERIYQSVIEPQPEKILWGHHYFPLFKAYEDHGIDVTAACSGFPSWAMPKGSCVPHNLEIPYEFSKKLAKRLFKGKIAVWEFWNEPDRSWDASSWDFAAVAKAAYLGFKAGDPSIVVTNGSFSVPIETNKFIMETMGNDLAEYIDIFNIHCYEPLKDYRGYIENWRKLMHKHGIGDLPIWVTENGIKVDGNSPWMHAKDDTSSQTLAQEMIWAESVPKCQILMQSFGVSRTFLFVLPSFYEKRGCREWGIINKDYSTKAAFCALATLTNQLAAAEYLGQAAAPAGVSAFLYRDHSGSQTVAFWSHSRLDLESDKGRGKLQPETSPREYMISSQTPATLTDIFGTSRTIKPENGVLKLTATRFPAYLSGVNGIPVEVSLPKPRPGIVRNKEVDKTIVFRLLSDENSTLSGRTLLISRLEKPAKLTLKATNFSDVPKSGIITANGLALPGFPTKMELGPMETKEISFELPHESFHRSLTFNGTFNGRAVTRLSANVLQLPNAKDLPILYGVSDIANWHKNSSGETTNISWDDKEQAVRVDVNFPAKVASGPEIDRWIYPEFKLPTRIPPDTLGISFEIKTQGPKGKQNLIMEVDKKNKLDKRSSYTPSLGEWQSNFIILQLPPDSIDVLRIGMNLSRDVSTCTYWIRNLRLVPQK